MERYSISSLFRSCIDAYESAVEEAKLLPPSDLIRDTQMLAQAVSSLGQALNYLGSIQKRANMIPDETTLKEAWLSLIKAQYYVDGKIPTQDVIPYFMSPVELQAFIDGCDFSDLPKYQGYIREAMINIAECLITLGDVICQGPNGNIGLRGGILVGLSRACYAMRGLKFPEFEAEKEEPCG